MRWRSASRSSRSCTTRPSRRTEEAFGLRGAARLRDEGDAARAPRGRSSRCGPPSGDAIGARLARLRRARPRPRAGHRPPARPLRSVLAPAREPRPAHGRAVRACRRHPARAAARPERARVGRHLRPRGRRAAAHPGGDGSGSAHQLRRLGRHSAIYGLGGLVSRILAVLLLPLYTRYLDPADFGADRVARRADGRARDDPAARDLERLLPLLLRLARPGAAAARRPHVVLVHDGERDARARRRLLVARRRRSRATLLGTRRRRTSSRAGFVGALGADELRAADRAVPGRGALDRVRAREPREHRPSRSAPRSCSSSCSRRARSASSSATSRGTLSSTSCCSRYRREQLGLQFDRGRSCAR